MGGFVLLWIGVFMLSMTASGFAVRTSASAEEPPYIEEIGQIKHLTGTVELLRNSQAILTILGDVVRQGDMILTGKDGSVGITLIDDARIALGPNSRLVIQMFQFNAVEKQGRSATRLERGTGVFGTGATSMTITTPKSTMEMHGTRIAVEVR